MIDVLWRELPALCFGALIAIVVLAAHHIRDARNPDRAWSRRHRAQRAELRRIHRKPRLP